MSISIGRAALYSTTMLAAGVALYNAQYFFQTADTFSFAAQRETYGQITALLFLHIGGGFIALITGPMQFFPGLRAKRAVHVFLGRAYVSGVVIGGLAGFPVAAEAYGGPSNSTAFGLLSVLWLSATYQALKHIRRGDIQAHRIWMVRSFALTFAAVTLRLELGILTGLAGMTFDHAYLVVPWTCWVLNLLVAEWVIVPQLQGQSSFRGAGLRVAQSPAEG